MDLRIAESAIEPMAVTDGEPALMVRGAILILETLLGRLNPASILEEVK